MIDSVGIYKAANSVVRECGTRNPFQIAHDLGIKIFYSDEFDDLLGMYTCKWKHRIIILNNRLDDYMRMMVCGHELGHDACHRELAKDDGMKEFVLFNMINHTEYEANAYSAHLLLDDDRVYSLAREGYDVVQMAKAMGSNVNLNPTEQTYILNTNTKKFHNPDCASAKKIKDENKQTYSESRDDLIAQGYDPCKNCNP